MQLSNGDKLNLTLEEFTAVTGKDPRPPALLRQERRSEKPAKLGRS
jgi:hypothetical protein